MSVELEVCRACGKVVPKLSMSRVDDTICARCASKLIARAQIDDGSWLEDGLSLGVKHWEQFPTEPRSAYLAFTTYRDAYPAELSNKELSEITGYGINSIRHWSRRWRWRERFFEWSKHCDQLALVEQHDIRKEMNDKQIEMASDLFDKALARIGNIDVDELDPKTTLQWAEVASKLKRQAVEDNREMTEKIVESRQFSTGSEKKAEEATADKSLQEILNILAGAGALNITTTTKIETPKIVEPNAVEAEYTEDDENE